MKRQNLNFVELTIIVEMNRDVKTVIFSPMLQTLKRVEFGVLLSQVEANLRKQNLNFVELMKIVELKSGREDGYFFADASNVET